MKSGNRREARYDTRMNRRNFLRAVGGGLAAPLAGAERRPNIIIILADDMGFSDLACYGSEIATPNLDRLAKGGLRFTQFYNTARCCPTRASLLTGLYPHQAGVGHMVSDYGVPGYRGDLNRQCVTIAEALRPAGYHTLMSGKWHVTPAEPQSKHNWPLQRGFEKYFGIIHGAASYYNPVTLTRDNEPFQGDRRNFYLTDAIAANAVDYIKEYAAKPDPFFLYTAFTSPHWPLPRFSSRRLLQTRARSAQHIRQLAGAGGWTMPSMPPCSRVACSPLAADPARAS